MASGHPFQFGIERQCGVAHRELGRLQLLGHRPQPLRREQLRLDRLGVVVYMRIR